MTTAASSTFTNEASTDPSESLRKVLDLMERFSDRALLERTADELYAEDATFSDPMQTCVGRGAIVEMMIKMLDGADLVEFDVHEANETDRTICLHWTMRFKLKPLPKTATLMGATWMWLDDSGMVKKHVDYWDAMDLIGELAPPFKMVQGGLRRIATLFA